MRLYLSQTGIERSSFGALDWLGWELVAKKLTSAGGELVFRDYYEDTLLGALGVAAEYSDHPLEPDPKLS